MGSKLPALEAQQVLPDPSQKEGAPEMDRNATLPNVSPKERRKVISQPRTDPKTKRYWFSLARYEEEHIPAAKSNSTRSTRIGNTTDGYSKGVFSSRTIVE
mmetsp:Transcript_19638/g.48870  ORF Transcript_19638/g.48870 Transcript_19638/m.48870 type:complete len:101 (+) Transcript_19638:559-861(+)